MSASLHWKYAPKEPEDSYLSHDLMFILRKRYWDQGFLANEVLLTPEASTLNYLQELADAKVEDADVLLGLLRDNPEGVILYHWF